MSISLALIFMDTKNCNLDCSDLFCVNDLGFDDMLELETGFGQAMVEVAIGSSVSCGSKWTKSIIVE